MAALNAKTRSVWIGPREGTAADFTPDSDPATVEFVILKPDKLPSAEVSADGQVIFLRNEDIEAKDRRIHWLIMESALRRVHAEAANGS